MRLFPQDPIMQTLHDLVLRQHGSFSVRTPLAPTEYFADLCETILGQQLSEKVAPKIIERVKASLGGAFTPEKVLNISQPNLRQQGTSNAKASYLHNLAQCWMNGSVEFARFPEMLDEEIIVELCTIKGIGRWTAEMFLMGPMGRPDVFSVGDFALRKAMMLNYPELANAQSRNFLKIAEKWSPNRTVACRVLWKSLEKGV